ncbi:MAG: NUDIX hydrolase [Actinomycetia bacterium]|nr:NUDIX hydrolase [Actinomycetes bacterium]MCP3911407.1 NUDIX hydrolase [Actinomycetes bacterium]MCP4084216.1 NUDIX hydrolase [Actinomycetes bacterium]
MSVGPPPKLTSPHFRPVDEEILYEGYIISLAKATMQGPNGDTFDRDVVRHPGAVSVVPLISDEVVLVRQYRAALDADLLEIPAGKLDVAGEDLGVAAQRELGEEVGFRAGHLDLLARFHNSAGFCDELSYVFLGTDLTEVPLNNQGIEEELMTIERVKLDQVPALIASGELTDAKTIIGLSLTLQRLGSGR